MGCVASGASIATFDSLIAFAGLPSIRAAQRGFGNRPKTLHQARQEWARTVSNRRPLVCKCL
jgi:hypothetical protein